MFFLPLGDPLVATFNETRAPTSTRYVATEDIVMSNWLKTFQTFWSPSSIFALEKCPKNLNFHSFLSVGDPLVATFSQTRALTLGKYVAEQGVVMSNWLKTFQTCWSHSSLFALEKQANYLNFLSFLYLK